MFEGFGFPCVCRRCLVDTMRLEAEVGSGSDGGDDGEDDDDESDNEQEDEEDEDEDDGKKGKKRRVGGR